MLDPKKLTKEQVKTLQKRFFGTIFGLAIWLGIWFDDEEIKYIETKMMTHKLYRLVNGNVAGLKPCEGYRLFDFQRSWLLSFLDDKNIPVGVRAYIFYYIGYKQAGLKINDEETSNNKYASGINHQFLVERWMEICR